MGAEEDNGLTLEGLAHRLEALERENERMRSENAELRQEVSSLRASGTRRGEVLALRGLDRRGNKEAEPSDPDGLVSRRSLLTKTGAAAVAAVAAGTLLNPREARAHDQTELLSTSRILAHWAWLTNHIDQNPAVQAEATTGGGFAGWGAVDAKNFGSGPGVRGTSETAAVEGIATGNSGIGVEGKTEGSNGTGVKGTGRYGVWGETQQAGFYGVFGRNLSTTLGGSGIRGVNEAGDGVYGLGKNGGAGVTGESSAAGRGAVEGTMENASGYGVWGNSWGISVTSVPYPFLSLMAKVEHYELGCISLPQMHYAALSGIIGGYTTCRKKWFREGGGP